MDYSDIINSKNIEEAYGNLKGIIKDTPLEKSRSVSEKVGGEVFLKLENLQRGGSFKIRGAYNFLYNIKKDVIAASAGNHSQGVALAARLLGLHATIVMPEFAPPVKVEATRNYGADVILFGKTFDEATEFAKDMARHHGLVFAHAFDNPFVIAGQGTIGAEILEEAMDSDYVLIPVGGGGLISGISLYLKEKGYKGKIIGVESEKAASMKLSFQNGFPFKLESVSTIADGIAIKSPSELTFNLARKYIDDVVTVSDNEISEAMFILLERGKIVAEPAGAASAAALLSGKVDARGKKSIALISGGNVDLTLLTQIIEYNLLKIGREFTIKFVLDNRPGELKKAVETIASLKLSIEELNTELFSYEVPVGRQMVTMRLKVYGNEALSNLVEKFKKYGFDIIDIKGIENIPQM